MKLSAFMMLMTLLAGSVVSCAGEAAIERRGWREAIECIESYRSHEDCREAPRDDAPYLAGWNAAIECMEKTQNLRACREPPSPS